MSRATQAFSLLALSAIWLGIAIPGTTSEHGTNWEALISVGILPVGALWAVFLFSVVRKRRD
ncbi:MAG: hypothetical protein A3D95_11455 [Betaproteobacteria bacterium RIFCSPHIGHO2_12_FULL_69_13]|nr:MAG: hypothetical protein A3D95_11455 [Betaproteobacteria bacterium RIFCSPHIGHO2_12_FULL_69_13]OGA67558.1 MAG: hypothetical protein A3G83_03735 [Betaproteobacteria bacterium RIFCSPLOWO2_12_FULL_68_20]